MIDHQNETCDVQRISTNLTQLTGFCCVKDILFGYSQYQIVAWNRKTLEKLGQRKVPAEMVVLNDRIFKRDNHLYIAKYTDKISFTLLASLSHEVPEIIDAFERPMGNEFYSVVRNHGIFRVSDMSHIPCRPGFGFSVSNCRRYAFMHKTSDAYDLQTDTSLSRYLYEYRISNNLSNLNQSVAHIRGIAFGPDRLLFKTRKGSVVTIDLAPSVKERVFEIDLCPREQAGKFENLEFHSFERIMLPELGQVRAFQCVLDDKDSVWFDSRGLLHLCWGGANRAEHTFCIRLFGPIAGWSSDGQLWGASYFTGFNEGFEPPPSNVIRDFSQFTHKYARKTPTISENLAQKNRGRLIAHYFAQRKYFMNVRQQIPFPKRDD